MRQPLLSGLFLCCFLLGIAEGNAATIEPDPQTNKPEGKTEEEVFDTTVLKPVNVSEPTGLEREPGYFYKYNNAFSVRIGPYFLFSSDGNYTLYGIYGISYLWPSESAFHIETGVDNLSFNEGHVWAQAHWNIHSTERFRPYYSAGLGFKVLPQDNLGAALSIYRYFVQGEGGFEYSLWGSLSGRADLFAGIDASWNIFTGLECGFSLGF